MKSAQNIQKTTLVGVNTLKMEQSVLDTKGYNLSYINRERIIDKYPMMAFAIIDSDNNVLSGTEDVEICKDKGIEKISVLVMDKKTPKKELRKLEIELQQSHRYITPLEMSILTWEHCLLSQGDSESYTLSESERLNVSRRIIQIKREVGQKFSLFNDEFKSIINTINLREKIPQNLLIALTDSNDKEKEVVVSKIKEIGIDKITIKDLKTIIAPVITRLKLDVRNRKLNKNLEKSKETLDTKFKEEDFEKLNDIISEHDEIISLRDVKKLFQYEIKKHFKLKINQDEKSEVEVIKSECSVNFQEEIELIKSLVKKD